MIFRSARITDVEAISELLDQYAAVDLMLQRPKAVLYERIREFIVVEDDGIIVAMGALSVIWKDLAEIRSLAVSDQYRGKGLGKAIAEKLMDEAKALGLEKVFALTYQVEFFSKLGFELVDKNSMPQKVWKDCVNCHKFPDCDENAMMKYVSYE